MEFFHAGGPIMWPLLLCSIASVSIVFERIWFWSRIDIIGDTKKIEVFIDNVSKGKEVHIENGKCLVLNMVQEGYAHRKGRCSEVMQAIALDALSKMRHGMSVLDTVITIAPMLGILGTVLGIISSFDMLGQANIEDPKVVVAGIAEALITTATGLTISVATVFPYNYFNSRMDAAQDAFENYGTQLEVALEEFSKKDNL